MKTINLYQAKTGLSGLVDRARGGEPVVIAKNGVPMAILGPLPPAGAARVPVNALGVVRIADDFDSPDGDIAALFGTAG